MDADARTVDGPLLGARGQKHFRRGTTQRRELRSLRKPGEVSGLHVRDIDLSAGLIVVKRQTYPGRGGPVTKATKRRPRRRVPIIAPVRHILAASPWDAIPSRDRSPAHAEAS